MSTSLRTFVALLVAGLLALLAGCGSGETASDGAGRATGETTGQPTEDQTEQPTEEQERGPVDFTQIALVSESNVEATVSERATVLDDRRVLEEFAAGFGNPRMTRSLTTAYDTVQDKGRVPDGEVLIGAVVSVSCQPPAELHVERTGAGLEITAVPMKSKVQCLVPVTTVALVSVPESAA